MKRIIACAGIMALVSGIAVSETPDSRDSLMDRSDFRNSGGETRAFWQYQFGHADKEINGLRYGLRYEQRLPYSNGEWRAPLMELVRNVDDPLMPFELNVSGMNLLDQNYRLNADGGLFGLSWTNWGTLLVIGGATAYAITSADEGDNPPKRESSGGGGGDGGGTDNPVDLADNPVDLGGDGADNPVDLSTTPVTFGDWSVLGGGYGYVPNEPMAPHQIEKMHEQE